MFEPDIRVPVTYQREWQEGFGAHGWKLDVSIVDPVSLLPPLSTAPGYLPPFSCMTFSTIIYADLGSAVIGTRPWR